MADFAIADGTVKARPVIVEVDRMLSTTPLCLASIQRLPAARNPLGRVGEHGELANLASFLISDQAGYINGEMVVQDGGAHLRGSGAEDLLQWTDAQWEKQRAARKA